MLNLAVIGTGRYGTNIVHAFRQLESQGIATLVSICDTNQDVLTGQCKKYNVQGYADYREMFDKEKIDAAAIATPDHLHRDIAVFAVNAGKHVLVEKPMDVTVDGCLEMKKAAEKNKSCHQKIF